MDTHVNTHKSEQVPSKSEREHERAVPAPMSTSASPNGEASTASSLPSVAASNTDTTGETSDFRVMAARYQALILATGQMTWTVRGDGKGGWEEVGHDWCLFTGQDPETASAWGWLDALHPDDRERVAAAWNAAIAAKSMYETEYRVRRHDGEYRWLLVRGVPVLAADNNVREWMGFATDITERKQTEEALRASEARLAAELADTRQIQRISSRLIHEGNLDDLYEQILTAAIAVMRSDMGSMQMLVPERNALRLLAWKGFDPASAAFWESVPMDSGSTCSMALRTGERVIAADIETCDFMAGTQDLDFYRLSGISAVQSTPLVSRDGRVVGMISTHWHTPYQPDEHELRLLDVLARQAADLIERKQAEQASARLAAIVTSADDAIASKTLNGIVTSWNASAERMFGYTASEMIGQSILRIIPPDRHDEEDRILARLRAGKRIEHFETVRVTKDGRMIEVALTISPIRDSAGTIIGASKIARDITERKRADEELKASRTALLREQERLRIALAASETGTFRWNPHTGEYLDFDENLKRLFGFAPDEPVRVTEDFIARVHPDDVPALIPAVDACREGADFDMEYRVVLPDGSIRWLYDRAKMEHDAAGRPTYLVGACTDITRRKQVEAVVRESEEKFRTLADNIPTLAWMARPDGYIFWYNQRWYDYTGMPPETQEGWGWQSVHDSDVLPLVVERWQQSLVTGEPFEMVFPLKGADGVFRPFLTRIAPVRNEQGQIVRWFGTNTDITEQRAAEEALRLANQVKDEFLGIASHELRTPLTSIQANIQLIKQRLGRLTAPTASPAGLPLSEQALRDRLAPLSILVERTERQMRRLNRLVGDLLDVTRIQSGKLEFLPEPCDLITIVREAVDEQRAAWPGRSITLDTSRHRQFPLHADADRIGQVVTNYLTNALKYSPPDQPVMVQVRLAGGQARVEVRDQGPGLTAEQQAHVFEQFYRVPGIKQQSGSGIGLGLGLSICKAIVERHRGRVGVASAPGEGSTFWFTLPTPGENPPGTP